MKNIEIGKVEQTPFDNLEYVTEVAYNNLVDSAIANGLLPKQNKPLGLEYLPTLAVTQQFKDACRAVIKDLGVEVKNPNET